MEAVIAADHCTHGILHPSVVEVAFTSGQRFHELLHGVPCRRTHPFRLLAINGDPLLAFPDVTGVLNRVFVFRHQVLIDRLANGCDSYFIHNSLNHKSEGKGNHNSTIICTFEQIIRIVYESYDANHVNLQVKSPLVHSRTNGDHFCCENNRFTMRSVRDPGNSLC